MRGRSDPQATILALVYLEERVPNDHPLRTIEAVADEACRFWFCRVRCRRVVSYGAARHSLPAPTRERQPSRTRLETGPRELR